jgi:hypothetical protein
MEATHQRGIAEFRCSRREAQFQDGRSRVGRYPEQAPVYGQFSESMQLRRDLLDKGVNSETMAR